ncbi:MAG: Uncharacterised protein [Rhodothermaeota bacterium MED-G12]|nr:MAG: Uncharacterised protein [Rhodothermaeota bacterium MED-G12]
MKSIKMRLFILVVYLSWGIVAQNLQAQTTLSMPDTTVHVSDTLSYPIYLEVGENDELYGIGFDLMYDSLQFDLVEVITEGTLTKLDGAFSAVNIQDNEVFYSLAATNSIQESGVLLILKLRPKSARISQIEITKHQFNELAVQTVAIRSNVVSFGNTPPSLIGLPDTLRFNQNDTLFFALGEVIQDSDDSFSELDFELNLSSSVIVVELVDSTASLLIYSPTYVGEVVLSGKVTDQEGLFTEFSVIIIIEQAVSNESIAEQSEFPTRIQLEQNYPNPFNPTTSISFEVFQASHVSVRIYDLMGREVDVLWNKYTAAGRYQLTFEASNLATGSYIYRLVAGNGVVHSKKMTLIK